ncbi:MAG: AAA family ATPase [Pirellulales bacterium]
MRIDRIQFENFNCFAKREFRLAPRFNLVIGDNAAGKTTVLDGLAVGLGGLFLGFPAPAAARSIHRDEVRLQFYLHGETVTAEPQFPAAIHCEGEVAGHTGEWRRALTSFDGRTTRRAANWVRAAGNRLRHRIKAGQSAILPLVSYYGTGRLWVQLRQREVETLGPHSRFAGYLDCLNPASDEKRLVAWFKTQEIAAIQRKRPSATLEACRGAVLACVPEAKHVFFDVARDELMLRFAEQELPFSYLSDGFRNMLAIAADIAVRCATLNPALEADAARGTPGVVLVDEIDLHLHPKWQRRVVGDLLRAFPNVQFVATTHSPFVIQSLPSTAGVQLLNLDDPGATGFVNKSVEDITEEVQGIELPQRSRRYQDMLQTAKKYFALLEDANNATPAEKEQLKRRLDELILPFSDDPAYQAFLEMQRTAYGFNGEGR